MTYALIDAGIIVKVGQLPTGARRLSDGAWITPYLRQWTDEQAADCGYLPVVDTAQPADTPTTIHERSVQLVAGAPTVVWTERPRTADELAQVTATNVTTDLRTKARTALTANQTFLDLASPTNAQTLAQVRRLTRECSALIRLLIGGDLLVENTDT